MLWSLAINTMAKAFVCMRCGVGLPLVNVRGHFKNRHLDDFPTSNRFENLSKDNLLKRYDHLVRLDVTESWRLPILPSTPQSYVRIIRGWTCIAPDDKPVCYHSTETFEKLRDHLRVKYNGDTRYTRKFVHLQTFFGQNLRKLFPTLDHHYEPDSADLLHEAFLQKQQEMWESGCSNIILDMQLPAFLRDARWLEVLQDYDCRQMVSLISISVLPQEHVLEGHIRDIVTCYLAKVNKLLGKGIHTEVQTRISVKMPEDK